MKDLSDATLHDVAALAPNYDRSSIKPGVVHLGAGAFHRAHQAVYIDSILAKTGSWGIIGASLRSADLAEKLNRQDGLYSVLTKDSDSSSLRVIGSISNVIPAALNGDDLLDALCLPGVRIVSLTITEKGYCHVPATGRLDLKNPDVKIDLANPAAPRTAIGFIVEALRRRSEVGVGPFTVMSCDNLPENGKITRSVVLDYAAETDSKLADWIARNATFPSTMVDRITPATTRDDIDVVTQILDLSDAVPVVTEPFSQWVIEDNFCAGRPPFDEAGALLVSDVAPFENMKLRMLNATHSMLAYLGCLSGFATIAEAVSQPDLKKLVEDTMTEEIIPSLVPPERIDLHAYRDDLIARYLNTGLKHNTIQIAMDGSQKIPQRLLSTIKDRIAADQPYDRLAFGVAGWMQFIVENGETLNDPLADLLRTTVSGSTGPADQVKRFLGLEQIFGDDLPADKSFAALLTKYLDDLQNDGPVRTIAALNKAQ